MSRETARSWRFQTSEAGRSTLLRLRSTLSDGSMHRISGNSPSESHWANRISATDHGAAPLVVAPCEKAHVSRPCYSDNTAPVNARTSRTRDSVRVPDKDITDHTRKWLWWAAGERCAF